MNKELRMVDMWTDLAETWLTVNRIYRVQHHRQAGGQPVPADKIRAVVRCDSGRDQSYAKAFLLTSAKTWAELLAAPAADWWKPGCVASDLIAVADDLAERARRVLR